MFYQNQKYQEYIENLKQNGVKLVGYRAPCCDKKGGDNGKYRCNYVGYSGRLPSLRLCLHQSDSA